MYKLNIDRFAYICLICMLIACDKKPNFPRVADQMMLDLQLISNDQSLKDQELSDRELSDRDVIDQALSDRDVSDRDVIDQDVIDQALSDRDVSDQELDMIHYPYMPDQSISLIDHGMINDQYTISMNSQDMMLPQSDMMPPQSDMMLPQSDMMLPQSDMMLPQSDMMLPQSDMMLPQSDMMLPQSDMMLPQSDMMLPQSDMMLPQSDMMLPQSDMMLPQSDMMLPQSDMMIDQALAQACQVPAEPFQEAGKAISEQEVKEKWLIAGPITGQKLWLGYFSPNALSYLIIRGGKLERVESNAYRKWETPSYSLQKILGVYDFDADGSLEILVSSDLKLMLIDSKNGNLLWKSEDQPISSQAQFFGLGRVLVDDLYQDGRKQIYFADGGCSLAGNGFGQIINIQAPLNLSQRTDILGPRTNGKCAQWHTLLPISQNTNQNANQNENPSIIITDNQGLHRFDANTGLKLECGQLADMIPLGAMPYFAVTDQSDPQNLQNAWVGWLNGRIVFLTAQTRPSNMPVPTYCNVDQKVIIPKWSYTYPLNTTAKAKGAAWLDLNGDGQSDLITNLWDGTRWQILAINGLDGTLMASWYDLASLGLWQNQFLLVAKSPNKDLTAPYQLNLMQISQDPNLQSNQGILLTAQWNNDLLEATPLQHIEPKTGASREFLDLFSIGSGANAKLVIQQASQGEDKRILSLANQAGLFRSISFQEPFGVVMPVCDFPMNQMYCQNFEIMAVSTGDSNLMLLNDRLDNLQQTESNTYQSVYRPSNTLSSSWVNALNQKKLLTLSQAGKLELRPALKNQGNQNELLISQNDLSEGVIWSVRVGKPLSKAPRIPATPLILENQNLVITRNYLTQQLSWSAYDLSQGHLLWTHSIDSTKFQVVNGLMAYQQNQGLMIRDDRLISGNLADLATCSNRSFISGNQISQTADPNFLSVLPACPSFVINPRVISAIDPQTGTCIWQAVIRLNNACIGPSNVNLSIADVNHDGESEIYVTETDAVRQFNLQGQLLRTISVPSQINASTGGGQLVAFPSAQGNGLIRYSALKPIHAMNEDLSFKWMAPAIPTLKDTSWIFRSILLTNQSIYLSPGVSLPLHQYDYQGNLTGIWQADGNGNPLSNVSSLNLQTEILSMQISNDQSALPSANTQSDPISRIWVAQDNGFLFELDESLGLRWKKQYNSASSTPKTQDFDADGDLEWAVALEEGAVWVYDQANYLAPKAIWERDCAFEPTCELAEDIDQINQPNHLCFSYTPVIGADGLEVQLQGESGYSVTSWIQVSHQGNPNTQNQLELGHGDLQDLNLNIGGKYRLAYRAWQNVNHERRYSAIQYSDGFQVQDLDLPQGNLQLSAPALNANQPLMIGVSASDQNGLVGWSLVVYDLNNRMVKFLDGGALQEDLVFTQNVQWDATDRFSNLVGNGEYLLVLTLLDQGRNFRRIEQTIRVE